MTTASAYGRNPDEEERARRLFDLKASGFAAPPEQVAELAEAAADLLGSPDPELRDDLALSALYTWIIDRPALSTSDIQRLARRALGENGIRHRLGATGDDSIFRRSFSLLLLALIVAADNQRELLTADEWREVLESLVDYCRAERDLRARVPGRGWAHAAAHAADVADECARSRFADAETAAELFGALAVVVDLYEEVFQAEEDERIALALSAMVERGHLAVAAIRERADSRPAGDEPRINWKLIARALYFRMESDASAKNELKALQAALLEM
jgi:hypothetical protein